VGEGIGVGLVADLFGRDASSFDANRDVDLIAFFGTGDEGARERFLLGRGCT